MRRLAERCGRLLGLGRHAGDARRNDRRSPAARCGGGFRVGEGIAGDHVAIGSRDACPRGGRRRPLWIGRDLPRHARANSGSIRLGSRTFSAPAGVAHAVRVKLTAPVSRSCPREAAGRARHGDRRSHRRADSDARRALERERDLGCESGVRDDERAIRGERPAAALLVQPREDERRHVLAGDLSLVVPRRARARSAARRRRGSRPAGARRAVRRRRAPSVRARSRRPRRPSPRARTPLAHRAPRRRAAARRCGSRVPARRASRAPPSSRHVEQRLHAGRHDDAARARQLAEIRGDVEVLGPAAVHAAEPARRHDGDPRGATDGKRPADRGRADGDLHGCRGEIARPDLARRRVEARELVARQTDAHGPSSTPIVAGTAPAARTRASDSRPTATPSPGGKPCATSVVSSATTARGLAHLGRDVDHSRLLHRDELDLSPALEAPHVPARLAEAGALVDLDGALVERRHVELDQPEPVALAPELEPGVEEVGAVSAPVRSGRRPSP